MANHCTFKNLMKLNEQQQMKHLMHVPILPAVRGRSLRMWNHFDIETTYNGNWGIRGSFPRNITICNEMLVDAYENQEP
ncbi:hypothetical protein IMY05_001G0140300 [Salix suchowensis]|nr:hypothetical protein IMY05_001G0140300 [Salix suchowensis]